MSPSDYFQPFVDWADGFGLMGLALVSATEAAFQPIPPDVLVIPMVIEADSILGISLIVIVATLSSVLGAFFGYGIGYYGGIPLLERFVSDSNINRLNFLIEKYGSAGVFIAAISPIPYKALAWIAGAGRMDLRLFALAGIFFLPGCVSQEMHDRKVTEASGLRNELDTAKNKIRSLKLHIEDLQKKISKK